MHWYERYAGIPEHQQIVELRAMFEGQASKVDIDVTMRTSPCAIHEIAQVLSELAPERMQQKVTVQTSTKQLVFSAPMLMKLIRFLPSIKSY